MRCCVASVTAAMRTRAISSIVANMIVRSLTPAAAGRTVVLESFYIRCEELLDRRPADFQDKDHDGERDCSENEHRFDRHATPLVAMYPIKQVNSLRHIEPRRQAFQDVSRQVHNRPSSHGFARPQLHKRPADYHRQ